MSDMLEEANLRSPSPPPHNNGNFPRFVKFRHPGYPDVPNNVMFRLARNDCNDSLAYPGVQLMVAMEVCYLISCNTEGFLSTHRLESAPTEKPHRDEYTILPDSEYYYYPSAWLELEDGDDLLYPVCPSFGDWQFPHSGVDTMWKMSFGPPEDREQFRQGFSIYSWPDDKELNTNTVSDKVCRATSFEGSVEVAHLVPHEEEAWFLRNGMSIYNKSNTLPRHLLMSDVSNCIPLRADVKFQLDAGGLVFIPKHGESCIHVLTDNEYVKLLHNRKTHSISAPGEFVFARFAWAVFRLSYAFANTPGVKVRVWCPEENTWKNKIQGVGDSTEIPRPSKRLRICGGE